MSSLSLEMLSTPGDLVPLNSSWIESLKPERTRDSYRITLYNLKQLLLDLHRLSKSVPVLSERAQLLKSANTIADQVWLECSGLIGKFNVLQIYLADIMVKSSLAKIDIRINQTRIIRAADSRVKGILWAKHVYLSNRTFNNYETKLKTNKNCSAQCWSLIFEASCKLVLKLHVFFSTL